MISFQGKEYKKSKFNILVPYANSSTIIFNSLSGAIGLFNSDTLQRYESDTLSASEIEVLIQKKVLVPSNLNENAKIDQDRIEGIQNEHTKFYRIWTTSGCNANCFYCFEHGIRPIQMSRDVAEKVANYIASEVKENDAVRIEWFGGEPLLNLDAIDIITAKLSPIFQEKHIVPKYGIITNGSLVNDKVAKQLIEKWSIKKAQITLDGFEQEYEKAKAYKDDTSFAKIISNIHMLLNNGIMVSIRMNYSHNNFETLKQLIEFLAVEFQGEQLLSAYVYPLWSALNPHKDKNGYKTEGKADDDYINLCDLILRHNLNKLRHLARLNYKKHQCMACNIHSITFFPDGTIGKCGEVFNQTIGNVEEGITNTDLSDYWTNPSIDDECVDCAFLPLCQGGDRSAKYSHMPKCIVTKDIMPGLLKWYVNCLKRNKETCQDEKTD